MSEMNNTSISNAKKPSLVVSLIPILAVFLLLVLTLTKLHIDIQIPLIIASVIASVIAVVFLKCSWKDIEQGIFDSIMGAMQAILIACLIGMIIGSWIQGGIVPSIVYYGLKILSPKFFLVTCLIVCSLVALATGSSWTTAGTLGVAMIGIGAGMGIPAPVVAGCVVSAGYFGDKMSPFSDTTNLAPAVSGTTIFAHIRQMLSTTGVAYLISIVVFMFLNMKYTGAADTSAQIAEVSSALDDQFVISPLLILPVLVLIGMIYLKAPALPGLVLSVVIGMGCAWLVQHASFASIGDVLSYGYESASGNEMIDELLSKGGLQNMMWTVSLILCSLTFGGVMHSSGMLGTIAEHILKAVSGPKGLIFATGFTAALVDGVCGEQYLGILLTGKMYKEEYESRNLAPQMLSATLENFGTVISPLIPWTTCAVAMSTYMGVSTVSYLPYAFFNYMNPLIALIFALLGIQLTKRDQVDPADIVS